MIHNIQNRAFTLIELLIVMAIIGVLAAVIIPSLNDARYKAVDAKVKSNLIGVRGKAPIYYDDTGRTYLGFCNSSEITDSMNSAKESVSGVLNAGGLGDGECLDTGTTWAAWVNMLYASTSAFCVDSTGASKVIPAQNSASVDHYSCPP